MVQAPTGTVTFLFTDVEGSTLRWERDGHAMAEALARHDDLLRSAIATCGGHVFKTGGDAFYAAFADPAEAAGAALEIQRRLAAEDFSSVDGLRVRIALHSGTAHQRDGDYFGPTLNRVARLLALGHGGQILLSATTAALLAGTSDYRDALLDLGEHKLKDLVAPERVSQLVGADGPVTFAPLRTAIASHNLPHQISSFVGRSDDIAAIRALLAERRGVTLTGTGGVGKTRCAVEVALDALSSYKDGVRYVELATLDDPLIVASAVAATIEVRETANEPVMTSLKRALGQRQVLIVLDNCEHLIDAAANFAADVLAACPRVSILATSREPLSYNGETLYRMPSLAVPVRDGSLTASEAARYSAVALFTVRAKASNGLFELTDHNAGTIALIVRKLGGIALAIELAAARLRTMNERELAARLDERLSLLTTGSRTASPRQRTMRGLIDWSWDLLTTRERLTYARLCVFATHFSLDAAQTLCRDEDLSDVVAALVDKSVVAVDLGRFQDADSSFRIIEALREYGLEKLKETGEAARAFSGLLAWSVALANEAGAAWETMPSQRWESHFASQLDNLRAALHWALEERNDVGTGTLLCARLSRMFGRVAPFEGRRWTELALRHDDGSQPHVTAELRLAEATVHVALREKQAVLDAARLALVAFEDLGDDVGAAQAAVYLGYTLAVSGDPAQGKPYLLRALELFRQRQLGQSAAIAAEDLAIAHLCADENREAQRYFEEALSRFQDLENVRGIVDVSINLGELAFRLGRLDEATALAFEAAETPNTDIEPTAFVNLTAYLIAADRFEEAGQYARASLDRCVAANLSASLSVIVQHVAAIGALRPETNSSRAGRIRIKAAGLCGASHRRLVDAGGQREFTEQQEYDRLTAALELALGSTAFEAATLDGQNWTDRQIVSEALAIL